MTTHEQAEIKLIDNAMNYEDEDQSAVAVSIIFGLLVGAMAWWIGGML